jgi:hypothetical protein
MVEISVDSNVYTYDLDNDYLTVPEVNPCMNVFENEASKGIAWLDYEYYYYQFTFPATRVFDLDAATTCDENAADDVVVFSNEGEVIDCDTKPFKYCDGKISFQGELASYEGSHEFSALGFTYIILPILEPGEDVELAIITFLEA